VKLRELLKKIRPKSLSGEGERPIDNVDGWASGTAMKAVDPSGGNMPATFPPNYVPPVDEGRPRH
jgi:hypothetical protein